jgi:hypothetical protein
VTPVPIGYCRQNGRCRRGSTMRHSNSDDFVSHIRNDPFASLTPLLPPLCFLHGPTLPGRREVHPRIDARIRRPPPIPARQVRRRAGTSGNLGADDKIRRKRAIDNGRASHKIANARPAENPNTRSGYGNFGRGQPRGNDQGLPVLSSLWRET